MGNVCDFQHEAIITSFDDYQQSQVFPKNTLRRADLNTLTLHKQISLEQLRPNSLTLPQASLSPSRKYLTDHAHQVSLTPPSEHSISKFRKLQEQSQVPSDFFDQVDFSLYFQTFKHLKQNFPHQFFYNNEGQFFQSHEDRASIKQKIIGSHSFFEKGQTSEKDLNDGSKKDKRLRTEKRGQSNLENPSHETQLRKTKFEIKELNQVR